VGRLLFGAGGPRLILDEGKIMKNMVRIIALGVLIIYGRLAYAQQTPPAQPAPTAADQDEPNLTLEEKIALVTDDVKRADAFDNARKAFNKAAKPIDEHQAATRKVIEAEHPGWTLENGQQGWHFIKKVEPAKLPDKK
jgi:hypothetical protein